MCHLTIRRPITSLPAADAGHRRVRKTVENGGITGTVANESTHYYYSGWRVIEERALTGNPGTGAEASGAPAAQYVWGGRYLDELWAFDRRSTGVRSGSCRRLPE